MSINDYSLNTRHDNAYYLSTESLTKGTTSNATVHQVNPHVSIVSGNKNDLSLFNNKRDQFNNEELDKHNNIVVVEKIGYTFSSILNFIDKVDNQFLTMNFNRIYGWKTKGILWKNGEEYMMFHSAFYNAIQDILKNPSLVSLPEKELHRIHCKLKNKIENFKKCTQEITRFEEETKLNFIDLLTAIKTQMTSLEYGSACIQPEQLLGISNYIRIRESLSEDMRAVLLPNYAFPEGDLHCINSAGSLFEVDIRRIETLGIGKKTGTSYSSEEITKGVHWFSPHTDSIDMSRIISP